MRARMNRKGLAACIAGLVLGVTHHPLIGLAEEGMPGGYFAASVADKEVVQAVDFAVKAEQEALQEKKDPQPAKLTLVKIVTAGKQVVAGMNFKLRLKVKLNAAQREAEAVVFRDLKDKFELMSWEWK